MELFLLATLVAFAAWKLRAREQGRRIALLGRHLGRYHIEKHMETLTQGYLRALGEKDPERREQIWNLLSSTEQELCSQFGRLAADFSRVEEQETRVSTLPVYVPFAAKVLPRPPSTCARPWPSMHAQSAARWRAAALRRASQSLRGFGGAVPDAAHLPLVLQVPDCRVGTDAGAAQDLVRADHCVRRSGHSRRVLCARGTPLVRFRPEVGAAGRRVSALDQPKSWSSKIATARVQPADAPRILCGKQEM